MAVQFWVDYLPSSLYENNCLETRFFFGCYSTSLWVEMCFLYSTSKVKVGGSQTNETIRFYWFLKMADPFLVQYTKNKALS